MKRILTIVPVLLIFGSTVFAQMQQKIGYVDSQVMIQTLPEAIKAQGELDNLSKKFSAQADSMTQVLQQEYSQYQKQQNTMNADKQREAQKSLVEKEQALNVFKQQKFGQNGDIYKKQEELFAPIKEKIMKGIQAVAKEEGMTFIFDKSGDIILLYADTAFDITYKVLDKLKRGK
ncbi:MAG: OmpH family outer membrane protein [Bacteroidota bacterium]